MGFYGSNFSFFIESTRYVYFINNNFNIFLTGPPPGLPPDLVFPPVITYDELYPPEEERYQEEEEQEEQEQEADDNSSEEEEEEEYQRSEDEGM